MYDGKRIGILRKSKGWNQTLLGDKLGVSREMVSSWERNKMQPPRKHLVQLANIFNTSVDYLLGETEEKTKVSILKEKLQNKNPNLDNFLDSDFNLTWKGKELTDDQVDSLYDILKLLRKVLKE